MLDQYGRLVESTRANVFLLRNGHWHTPRLTDQGVAGAFRAFLMDQLEIKVDDVFSGSLHRFESMFLCNSVRGIVPIRELAGVGKFAVGPCLALRDSLLPKLAMTHSSNQTSL